MHHLVVSNQLDPQHLADCLHHVVHLHHLQINPSQDEECQHLL